MKVGIIGSGISGLVAAWSLVQAGCHVTLFENQLALGMDAHSVLIDLPGGRVRGDVPSRMFNSLEWPNLFGLYEQLGVKFEAVDPSQSFSSEEEGKYLKLEVANRPQQVIQSLLSRKSRRILTEARRLKDQGEQFLTAVPGPQQTLGQFLEQNDYTDELKYEFLYPTLSSTVCTCSYESLDRYPVEVIFQILSHLTANQPLLKTKFGTMDVVERLTRHQTDIRLGANVCSVDGDDDDEQVRIQFELADSGASTETFDHVIVATQANHAAGLISNRLGNEQRCLRAFSYEDISVIVHTDRDLMPRQEKDWATFNMISDPVAKKAMCSVWMNQFHADWDVAENVFQTINPIQTPKPESVICNAKLQRPVVTSESTSHWESLRQLHDEPNRRIWFAGSYASAGVPLLETGVVSSLDIVQRIGFESQLSKPSVSV